MVLNTDYVDRRSTNVFEEIYPNIKWDKKIELNSDKCICILMIAKWKEW